MPLPFEPACLPLLIGGLPHRSAAQAFELSRRYAGTLLAWPQLPQRSFREQSVVQSAIGSPGLVIDPALAQHLRLRARWQEARLRKLAGATIICLNEPFLETVGLPFLPLDWETARDQIDEVLGGIAGCKALFARGAVDWPEVLQTSVEL